MSLSGLKVVEFAGLAPAPFAGFVLADNGASVIRIDKPDSASNDILCRGKRSLAINPKVPSGRETLKKLIMSADVVIDPFRPGVLERFGLGPELFLKEGANKRLIYARIAGFPRTGPQKDMAGHDINYLALSGVLSMLPGAEKPSFPLNLLADFAGGGLMCVLGILLALVARGTSGCGQVVNVDMVSGAQYVGAFPLLHALVPSSSLFGNPRNQNLLDGGAPFYNVYVCKDGRYMSVGCLEPQFFETFVNVFLGALPSGFDPVKGWRPTPEMQRDRSQWPELKKFLTDGFKMYTRDHWTSVFQGTDACALPVLTPTEVRMAETPFPPVHPQISPSLSPGDQSQAFVLSPGQHTFEILNEMRLGQTDIRQLVSDGALGKEINFSLHKL